jgi:hypothetical protein
MDGKWKTEKIYGRVFKCRLENSFFMRPVKIFKCLLKTKAFCGRRVLPPLPPYSPRKVVFSFSKERIKEGRKRGRK